MRFLVTGRDALSGTSGGLDRCREDPGGRDGEPAPGQHAVDAVPGGFVGDGLGAEGDAEVAFGALRGEVLAVAFEHDAGAARVAAGQRWRSRAASSRPAEPAMARAGTARGGWAPVAAPAIFSLTTFIGGMILLFSGATPEMRLRLRFIGALVPLATEEGLTAGLLRRLRSSQ